MVAGSAMAVLDTAAMLTESIVIEVYDNVPAMEMGERPPVPAPMVVAGGNVEHLIQKTA